jgi:Domain of unknown function (DUF4340)
LRGSRAEDLALYVMIKKPTLIVLLCAILLGGSVYYFDYRRSLKEKEKPPEDSSKPAFAIPSGTEINSLTLTHPAMSGMPAIQLEKRNGAWQILQPLQTDADSRAVQNIVEGLSSARVAGTEPGTPDRLKVYGLDPPAVAIDFQLANGSKHSVKLGTKDFTGISVYSVVDGGKDVSLLPLSLLTNVDLPLKELRDRSVLHIAAGNVASITLRNSAGELAASKEKIADDKPASWRFTKPSSALVDDQELNALLGAVANSKMTEIVAESADHPGEYGLSAPAITFSAVDDRGKTTTLLVGKKSGDEYFARDPSRPMVFRIDGNVFKKLSENYTDLRDKKLAHFDPADVNHLELRDANGTMSSTRKPGEHEQWAIDSPADQKGKSAAAWKIFTPLTTGRAEEVLDHPAPEILAKLAKPAIEVILTKRDGTKISIRFSSVAGDAVFAQTSESPVVYKLKKQVFDNLNIKPAELAF